MEYDQLIFCNKDIYLVYTTTLSSEAKVQRVAEDKRDILILAIDS